MKTFLFTAAKTSVLALGVAMGLASPSISAPMTVFPSAAQTTSSNIIQVRNEYDSGSQTQGENYIRRGPNSDARENRRPSERRVEQRRNDRGDRGDWRRNDRRDDRRGDWRRGDNRRDGWRGDGRRDDWRRHGRRDYYRDDYYRGGGSGIYFGFGAPAYRYEQPRYYAPPRRVQRTNLSRAHVDWCLNRYRSYRPYDNTFQPYNGPRQQCWSPYT